MNKTILIIAGFVLLGGSLLVLTRKTAPVASAPPAAPAVPAPPAAAGPSTPAVDLPRTTAATEPERAPAAEAAPSAAPPEASADRNDPVHQAVAVLLSPAANLRQKQLVWSQLRATGQLPEAIKAIQQQMADDPNAAEVHAALGEAYLYSITPATDVREQGILGLSADASFEAALKLDPSNWEAGFYKASAMTHWPESMNMGPKIVDQFTQLIQQQENQPAQPEFAQSYLLLGEEYRKAGQLDNARQVWRRGATLFPDNPALAARLEGGP